MSDKDQKAQEDYKDLWEFDHSFYYKGEYVGHVHAFKPKHVVYKWKDEISIVRHWLGDSRPQLMLKIFQRGLDELKKDMNADPPAPGTKLYRKWQTALALHEAHEEEKELETLLQICKSKGTEEFEAWALKVGHSRDLIDKTLDRSFSPPFASQADQDRVFLREFLKGEGKPVKATIVRKEAERRGIVKCDTDWERLSVTARREDYHRVGGHGEWGLLE